jgi:hypothetical protein
MSNTHSPTTAIPATRLKRATPPSVALAATFVSGTALGCACGCGVFDVGTGAMFPDGSGGTLYTEVDFMDQNQNWSGTSQAPADNNSDKRIKTQFYTLGGQYMFNRSWGIQVDVPYWDRNFTTTDDSGNLVSFQHAALGDIRIRGLYTGFSPDMSTGLTFGVKLPSGDSTYANFDPDTEIGTGSTDFLLGAYHLGKLSTDGAWSYYLRAQWQEPVKSKDTYRPGNEVIGVAGTYYKGWSSAAGNTRVVPLLQMTAAYRGHDGGTMGHPEDSGYTRLIAAPGLEIDVSQIHVFVEAGFAVYNNMSGNQLVAKQLYRINVSYGF